MSRYALARRRARRRELRRVFLAKMERLLTRAIRWDLVAPQDPAALVERRERTWCAIVGIPYAAIVPGSLRPEGADGRCSVALRRPLHHVTISGTIDA